MDLVSKLRDHERMSVIQLARDLGLHVSTVYRWILSGVRCGEERLLLRAVRVGGRRYVLRSDAEDFLRRLNPRDLEDAAMPVAEASHECSQEGL